MECKLPQDAIVAPKNQILSGINITAVVKMDLQKLMVTVCWLGQLLEMMKNPHAMLEATSNPTIENVLLVLQVV